MDELINIAYEEAENAATEVAKANYPQAVYQTVFGLPGERLFEVHDKGDPGLSNDSKEVDDEGIEIRSDVICSNIEGMVFDPKDVSTEENDRLLELTYTNKRYAGVIADLSVDFVPPIAPDLFGTITLKTTAGAQPYGGSVKRFGLLAKETSTLEEARGRAQELIDAGKPYWFRPALVPVYMAKAFAEMEDEDNVETLLQ
jgi:hypothetical protein